MKKIALLLLALSILSCSPTRKYHKKNPIPYKQSKKIWNCLYVSDTSSTTYAFINSQKNTN